MHAAVQRQASEVGRARARWQQLADGGMQVQRGLGGAAAVVLAHLGMAEHGQHAVALDARDDAAVTRHDALVELAQTRQHGGVMLGLHPLGHRGGGAQVHEQQGQQTALPKSG